MLIESGSAGQSMCKMPLRTKTSVPIGRCREAAGRAIFSAVILQGMRADGASSACSFKAQHHSRHPVGGEHNSRKQGRKQAGYDHS